MLCPMVQDNVEALGPYGPVFFVVTMVGVEMVPLFPTQPLTIASGILFGVPKVLVSQTTLDAKFHGLGWGERGE